MHYLFKKVTAFLCVFDKRILFCEFLFYLRWYEDNRYCNNLDKDKM